MVKHINIFLTVFATLFLSLGILQAQQQKYVQVEKDFTHEGIRFYKGEIYKLDTLESVAKMVRVFDTIKHFTVNNTINCSAANNTSIKDTAFDITYKKDNFIKIGTNDSLHIDLSSIRVHDTIWLIGDYVKIPFVRHKIVTIAGIGDKFRLIIPNTITIWYNKNQLEPYIPPKREHFITPNEEIVKKNDSIFSLIQPYWIIMSVLMLIIGGVAGSFLPKLLLKRNKKEQENKESNLNTFSKKVYDGSISLTEWVKKQEITIELLKQLNPEYKSIWGHLKKDSKDFYSYRRIQEKLKGKVLRVRKIEKEDDVIDSKIECSSPIFENKSSLDAMEKDLMQQQKENTRLETTLKQIEKELIQKKQDLIQKNEEVQFYQLEGKNIQAILTKTDNVVLHVGDSLKNYACKVYNYLYYCKEDVYKSAIKLYNDLQQPEKAGMLLMNFQTEVHDLQIDKWLQILFEIKEKGVILTSNKHIIQLLQQFQNDNDKFLEFQRFIFNEFLIKYSSNLLILAEAFRNLNRFGITIDNSWKSKFDVFVRDIQNKAQSIGMSIRYVPLFEKIDDYVHILESIGGNTTRAYRDIVDLDRDSIAEIVSYGIETEFNYGERTRIILA